MRGCWSRWRRGNNGVLASPLFLFNLWLDGFDEVFRGSVFGIDEGDVGRGAGRRVDGEDDQRAFDNFWNCVDGIAAEKQELAGAKFHGIAAVDHEFAAALDHLEIFASGFMEGRRGRPVDAKEARTGCWFVGEANVEQHWFGGGRKLGGKRV